MASMQLKRPERVVLQGPRVNIVPLDTPAHAAPLYAGSTDAALWRYLFNGPYANEADFRLWLEGREKSEDPLFFTILDAAIRRAQGILLPHAHRARPSRNRGRQHPVPPLLAAHRGRHRSHVPARPLYLRRPRIPPLRVEMRCLKPPLAKGGAAPGLHLRGNLPPAHDREGKESRHRLVLHAGHRVARPQARLRTMARAHPTSTPRAPKRPLACAESGAAVAPVSPVLRCAHPSRVRGRSVSCYSTPPRAPESRRRRSRRPERTSDPES